MCLSGFCVDPGPQCPTGTEACPCTPGNGCDDGLTCLSNTCVDADELTTGEPPATTAPSETSSSGGGESSSEDTTAAADSSSSGPAPIDPDSTG